MLSQQRGLASLWNVADLREAVKAARAQPLKDGSMAGIYGMAAKVPDRTLVADILAGYLDTLYLTRPPPAACDAGAAKD